MKKENKKNKPILKHNGDGTVDISAGELNLSEAKEKFSIFKFLRRIFHIHKYVSLGIIEFNVGEIHLIDKTYKLDGQKLEIFICPICNKMKGELVKN